jgi:Domain of unknown function (DUF4345)
LSGWRGTAERRLRAAMGAGGLVATSAGLHTVAVGGRSFPPWRRASAMVESEVRFYGAFYAAYGLAVLRTAARADRDPAAVRALAAALFLAGAGRAAAWRAAGRPHPLQQALLAIELAAPVAAAAVQARLEAAAGDA